MRDQNLELIAEQCYNAVNSIDGKLVRPWDKVKSEGRTLTIDGVKFLFKNPKATPEQVHDNWVKCRQELGWKFGEKFCVKAKTHPSMRPYSELEGEKCKDMIFIVAFKAASGIIRVKKKQ